MYLIKQSVKYNINFPSREGYIGKLSPLENICQPRIREGGRGGGTYFECFECYNLGQLISFYKLPLF